MSSRQRLFLATTNAHKTREFALLLGLHFEVGDPGRPEGWPAVEETGSTFEENAALKAISASNLVDDFVVADDSGLEVDALQGEPGVRSARYAGAGATDQENVEKLLAAMAHIPPDERRARFRCVLALARAGKVISTFAGAVEGIIAGKRFGAGGFGYDPVFIPAGYDRTFAELPASVKNEISHRAQAVRSMQANFSRAISRE